MEASSLSSEDECDLASNEPAEEECLCDGEPEPLDVRDLGLHLWLARYRFDDLAEVIAKRKRLSACRV